MEVLNTVLKLYLFEQAPNVNMLNCEVLIMIIRDNTMFFSEYLKLI